VSIFSDILIFRNMQSQTTTIIRNRGQLTIPGTIRARSSWATPGSVVTIAQVKADEIVIRPHTSQTKSLTDDLWRRIRRVRSFKGKGTPLSLSEFIAKDRENHF